MEFSGLDEAGHRLVSIWSTCGEMQAGNARPCCGITLRSFMVPLPSMRSRVDVLVIRGNLLADGDPLELTRTITAVAWQANQAAGQLLGQS